MLDGLQAQPYGEVALADAGRSQDDDVLAVLDEVAGAESGDLLLVERGLVGEVEGVEPLDEGEAGEAGAHGDVLCRLGADLL